MSIILLFNKNYHTVPEPFSIDSLQTFVFSLTTIPPSSQSLFYLNTPLISLSPTLSALLLNKATSHPKLITLAVPLRGGKGGFGSLLKSQRSNFVTTNFSAMRDLSGRRLRNVQLEAELSSYIPPDENRMAEIRRDFYAINVTGRVEQKRTCFFGTECKYRRKCRYLHPDEEAAKAEEGKSERERAEKRAREEDCEFRKKMGKRRKELERTLGKILSKKSVASAKKDGNATENTKNIKKIDQNGVEMEEIAEIGDKDIKLGEKLKFDEKSDQLRKIDEKNDEKFIKVNEKALKTEKKAKKQYVEKLNKDDKIDKIGVKNVKIAKTNKQNATNLVAQFHTAKELETLGLEKLKETLSSIGLKCGGTCVERAQRLFLIKHTPLSSLPKNVFAKN